VASDARIGTQLGPYRLEDTVGRGSMGVVYLARDLRLDRPVAVKVMAPELADDASFRERFEREARMAAAIDHPNIIPVYDTGEQDDVLYLAMRYVQGTDLRTLLVQAGALPPDRTVDITRQVASALDAAHREGLVHRDVKPANILLAPGTGSGEIDHVYLTDFGLTKQFAQAGRGLTATGQFVGTIDYVAPEQVEGQPVDGRADEYSLACVTFECLTGHPVFGERTEVAALVAHVHQPPPPVTSLRPDLPAAVDSVLARGLAKSPAERFDTSSDFVLAVRDALAAPQPADWAGETRPVPAPLPPVPPAPPARPQAPPPPRPTGEAPPSAAPPAGPSRRRSKAPFVAAGVVAALLVAGGVVFALTRGGGSPGGHPRGTTGGNGGNGGGAGPSLAWAPLPRPTPPAEDLRAVTLVAHPGPLGNTFLAAGWAPPKGNGTTSDPAVWLSRDGLTWTPAPGQPPAAGPGPQEIRGVSGVKGGALVAVGSSGAAGSEDAAVWRSTDGGEHWTTVKSPELGGPGDQSMNRVGGTKVGLVAVGFDTSPGGDHDGAIWTSTDGTTWSEATGGALGGPGDQEVSRATNVPGGGGLIAAGIAAGRAGDTDAAIWRSSDGRHWVRVSSRALGGPGNQGILDLQTLGDLLVAGGYDDAHGAGKDAALWVSLDGSHWTEITGGALGGAGDQVISRVYPTGSSDARLPALVAGGFEVKGGDHNAALWYSDDGRTWTRETRTAGPLGGSGDQEVDSIVAVGGTFPLIAVGRDGSQAGLWAARGPAKA
jgi:Protein kinase domain